MFKKSSRLISLVIIVALALTICCGAFAAESDASFTVRSIDGNRASFGGASFGLYGPDGSLISSVTTGANGTATVTIPAAVIGDTGDTNLTLVQSAAPAGFETTDNNWAVTVSPNGSVYVDTMGLWDTMYDWIDGTVVTGAEFENGVLTVANTTTYYELPTCYKTVSGLSGDQIKSCTSTFELKNAAGTVVATGHAIGYAEQANGSYTAPIAFDTEKVPGGTYTLSEKSVATISGMTLKSTSTLNGSTVTIGSRSVGETITVAYEAPYVAPVVTPSTDENPAETTDPEPSTTPVTDETGDPLTEGDTTIEDGKVPTTDGTEIEDEDTPTSDAPQQANATVWVIIVAAFVILAAAIYSITGKKIAKDKN